MPQSSTSLEIEAPVETVFDTIAHSENFMEASPAIVHIEFVTEQRRGAGTRFRETRRMGKREATVELEVAEYVANERVRIVSDEGGTIWDTLFTVTPTETGTRLDVEMDARHHKLMPRIVYPFIAPMIRKAVAADLEAVKEHCEKQAS